ncbi:hypothetical protein Pta02_00500 [Planobispora takensis]|uniref:Uncharacterized protein n=1 Tax=Planobispora takensis TaxID=1367882 RepID=A0A8J3WSL2_9ACTN|nr:hypothetical protein Pta02_00500 [Planobispora takensis]
MTQVTGAFPTPEDPVVRVPSVSEDSVVRVPSVSEDSVACLLSGPAAGGPGDGSVIRARPMPEAGLRTRPGTGGWHRGGALRPRRAGE